VITPGSHGIQNPSLPRSQQKSRPKELQLLILIRPEIDLICFENRIIEPPGDWTKKDSLSQWSDLYGKIQVLEMNGIWKYAVL
jgi:hypothetical protein